MAKGSAGQAISEIELAPGGVGGDQAFEVEGAMGGSTKETSNPLSDSGASGDWGQTVTDDVFEQEDGEQSDEEEVPTVRRSCPSAVLLVLLRAGCHPSMGLILKCAWLYVSRERTCWRLSRPE